MSSIFNIMPGLEIPIPKVTETLSKMWQGDSSLVRSSQFNIIVHNGLYASHGSALRSFNQAIAFAKKYPCRIIVLCPEKSQGEILPLKGKLFSQCFIGDEVRDQCCCEALILGYVTDDAVFLKDQVSLWLENDLPSYYWVNEISPRAIKKYYLSLADLCSKIVYDSAVEPEGFKDIDWTDRHRVTDLALMRLLPVRQSLGQFLSGYSEKVLIDKLEHITVEYSEEFHAEGFQLLEWFGAALEKCAQTAKKNFEVSFTLKKSHRDENFLNAKWEYADAKFFEWHYDWDSGLSEIKAKFCNKKIGYPLQLRKMTPEEVLAAAIFY